ncbi:hypothetical protein LZ31DRAFT_297264 [Colletotrichum somersetense]|nr:hypothetical protein LZ31DRAFT_297264 [Colletotrichum somersetense]
MPKEKNHTVTYQCRSAHGLRHSCGHVALTRLRCSMGMILLCPCCCLCLDRRIACPYPPVLCSADHTPCQYHMGASRHIGCTTRWQRFRTDQFRIQSATGCGLA